MGRDADVDAHRPERLARGRRARREQAISAVVLDLEPEVREASFFEPPGQCRQACPRALHLAAEHRGDDRRFVLGCLGRDPHGARLDAVDDHQPEPESEREHDRGQGQEHLHTNRQAAGSRPEEPRRDERDGQDEPHGSERHDDDSR